MATDPNDSKQDEKDDSKEKQHVQMDDYEHVCSILSKALQYPIHCCILLWYLYLNCISDISKATTRS